MTSGPRDDPPDPGAGESDPASDSSADESDPASDSTADESDPASGSSVAGPRHRSVAPDSTRHPWLTSGRIAVALVALLVFTATGWEWAIKSRADSGILSRQVDAIVTDDTNVSRPATPTTPPAGSVRAGEHPAARVPTPAPATTGTRATPTTAPTTASPTPTR